MTDKLKEKAQQALGALEAAGYGNSYAAIELREALSEQAEQEPVAWMDLHKELGKLRWMGGDEGWDNAINAVRDRLIELSAPVRTKDLTDDEIMKINVDTAGIVPTCDRQFHFARAVIAADREKNNV